MAAGAITGYVWEAIIPAYLLPIMVAWWRLK